MAKWEPGAAAAIIGFAAFQIVQVYTSSAPSLPELRGAVTGESKVTTQLKDADIMVGGLAVIVGASYTIMTKDTTAAIILIGVWGSMSLWYHMVLAADAPPDHVSTADMLDGS